MEGFLRLVEFFFVFSDWLGFVDEASFCDRGLWSVGSSYFDLDWRKRSTLAASLNRQGNRTGDL